MATVDELNVIIKANNADFNKKLDSVNQKIEGLAKHTSNASSKMTAGMVAMGGIIASAFTAAFSAITSSLDNAVARLDTLNNFPKVMSNLGIGAKDAQQAIDYMSEKLQGLPTQLDDAAMAVQRFTSANGNVKASTNMFLAVNNAILAGGASMDIQRSALEQLSQAYAKGNPDMMEWRTMLNAMPAQLKQVATAMGYADSSTLGEGLRTGTVSMNEFMATIVKLNKEGVAGFQSFEDQARNSTGGVATAMANLKNSIVRSITAVMDAIGQSNIAGFLNNVKNAILTAGNYVAAFVKVIITAINALAALFGGKGAQAKAAENSTASMADNIGAVASNADDATGALNDTGKAAKKLAQQLAGFDEMNVLKEPASGSGSGSGSGGGGGGNFNVSGMEFDADIFGESTDKVTELAEKMMADLKKIFDFNKIGKAIKRFADDVKKFLQPLGKIASDVWNNYLKPFVSWTGNDLFPAFLNAVGGAINLIGQVIGSVWSNFLKPFIDNFLVPIAQFTGGVIVAVLNGIGDALRGIAGNSTAVELISASLITLGAVIGSAMLANKITEIGTAFSTLLAKTVSYQSAAMSLSPALGSLAVQTSGLTGVFSSFGSTISGMLGAVFNPVSIAILAVVAAITAVVTAVEFFKTKQMEAEEHTKVYISTEEWAKQVSDERARGVNLEKEALDGLAGAIAGVNTANSDLVSAEENLRNSTTELEQAAKNNNMTTEEAIRWFNNLNGDMSKLDSQHLKLAKSVATYETAQDRSTQAAQKYKNATSEVVTQEELLYDAQSRQIRSMLDEQAQVLANKGDWEGLAKMLQETANKEYEFTTAQGETVRRSKDEMAWLTKGVADDVSKAHEDWDKIWNSFPNSVKKSEDDIRNTLDSMSNTIREKGQSSGNNYSQGIISGINSRNRDIYNAGWNQADQGLKGFNSRLQIHSPSRVMMKSGGWFSEGAAIGITDGMTDIIKASEKVAAVANTSFEDMINPNLSGFSTAVAKMNDTFESDLQNSIETSNQTNVVVKVGEDTLIDKVVDGINHSSMLHNQAVIAI